MNHPGWPWDAANFCPSFGRPMFSESRERVRVWGLGVSSHEKNGWVG